MQLRRRAPHETLSPRSAAPDAIACASGTAPLMRRTARMPARFFDLGLGMRDGIQSRSTTPTLRAPCQTSMTPCCELLSSSFAFSSAEA